MTVGEARAFLPGFFHEIFNILKEMKRNTQTKWEIITVLTDTKNIENLSSALDTRSA